MIEIHYQGCVSASRARTWNTGVLCEETSRPGLLGKQAYYHLACDYTAGGRLSAFAIYFYSGNHRTLGDLGSITQHR